ncbi:MAG: hypothetical protein QOK05_2995 [Chloroflexota bacterium]|nr:hypothetical protein [Chloroflexota bacterium]
MLVFHVAEGIALGHQLNYPLVFGPLAGAVLSHLDLGLYLFFVLSGYLITRSFAAAYVDGRDMPGLGRYVRNRLLRIVPAYWAIFGLLFARHLLLPDRFPRGYFTSQPFEILPVLGFAQNFNPFNRAAELVWPAWTLDVEIGFYLLVPVLLFGLAAAPRPGRRVGRAGLLAAVVLGLAIGSLYFRSSAPIDDVWLRSLPAMLVAFTPGVLLAVLEPVVAPLLRARPAMRHAAFLLLLLAAGFFCLNHLAGPYLPAYIHTAHTWRTLLAAVASGCVVAAPLWWQWCGHGAWRLLDNGPLRWVGRRSYSLYLVHWGIALDLGLVRGGSPAWAPAGPYRLLAIGVTVLLACSLAAAAASYRLFERPFLDLRMRRRT